LEKPDEKLRPHKTKIDLSFRDGISELLKLCNVAEKELKTKDQQKAAKIIKDFSKKIEKFSIQ
jgi:D-ribose pyranose/furanose isomerase RbsD